MASRTMSAEAIRRFIQSMEDQGVVVTRTKKGLFLRLPDNTSTTVHFTNSDVRAEPNLMARLRRAGVRHPDDPKDVKELPTNITEAPPVAPRSIRKVHKAIEQLGWPEVVTVQQIVDITEMVHITSTRTLYQMGFKPVKGKRNGRDWLTPPEILALKPNEEVVAEVEAVVDDAESPTIQDREEVERVLGAAVEGAREAGRQLGREMQAAGMTPEPKIITVEEARAQADVTAQEREFIDTHDSWVVNGGWPPAVADYLHSLRGAGLEVEIRVWRA